MATPYENMTTALANVAAQIADITENPKPDYSIDGHSVSWGQHMTNLMNWQKEIMEAMQRMKPYCSRTRGTV